ncbi:MAG: ATP/GTP-binding protein [Archaeoglobaceae archaeon]
MDQITIYMTGTAGSGKTYLTNGFSEWLDLKRLDSITVNLDPGVDKLPYTPDVDIREWLTLENVMDVYGVGPNGAQIICADLISTKITEVKDEIDYQGGQFVIVDTPGQMELFTLRSSSQFIVNSLGFRNSVMVFLFDPVISKTPSGLISLLFMSASAVFRLNLPQVMVLSKSDVLTEAELEQVIGWSTDPESLYNSLSTGTIRGLSDDLFHMLRETGLFRPLTPVSSTNGFGMEDIYDGIQEIFYGGEDVESMLY